MPTVETSALGTHGVQTEWLQLASEVRAFYARPAAGENHGAVVLLMDAFGLKEHIQDVARRLAACGYAAIVPDLHHGKTFNYSDMKENPNQVMEYLKTRDDQTALRDIGSAIEALEARPEVASNRVGVMGFCMGGRFAYLAATALGTRLAAAICFYGSGIGSKQDRFGRQPPLERTAEIVGPIMLMYGAEDKSIPPDEHGRIAETLSGAKKRFSLNVFPNAGHAFFSNDRESYEPTAAREAWDMSLGFLQAHIGQK